MIRMQLLFRAVVQYVVLVLLLTACDMPTPTPMAEVPLGATDNTLPLLQMGSAGLRSDILINQDSTQGQSR